MKNGDSGLQRRAQIWFVCLGAILFAALADVAAQQAAPSPVPEIRDISPPVDVFPYPLWLVASVAGAALLLLGIVTWLVFKWLKRRPAPPPPMPRDVALASLREAQKRMDQLDPYAFSILVSDILRRYVSAQYGLHAPQLTSPEFLARAANSPRFTEDERTLLAGFLEKCDLIKFAHIDATRDDSAALLDQAMRFVSGGERTLSSSNAGSPSLVSSAGGIR